jgi:hypothetical protein
VVERREDLDMAAQRAWAVIGVVAVACGRDPPRVEPTTYVRLEQSAQPHSSVATPSASGSAELERQRLLGKLIKATTVTEAMQILRPSIIDGDNPCPEPAAMLAAWEGTRDLWFTALLKAAPPTSVDLVLKDVDEERGKILCLAGTVFQISAKKDPDGMKLFAGGLSAGHQVLRFVAWGSTRGVVASTFTRFCGVTIGRMDYDNSGGGRTHGALAVGLFDLPENRGPEK